ncbi:Spiroplasmavirus-related protein [Spiroplasma kunkelii CR2-3x]|uniref:Spiroplasmavirus-related protein n=1 Tax=Spiroplasma kunkelii CR2-3x TaxID=273035 RepID=A0A0K2JIG7_SPIKU|nr:Spiroplasmavirus-related protein [Spiroplasma kunkelii CR2-3x]
MNVENVQDIKKANHHFRLFIRRLNYYFSKYKKSKYKDLKYLVAYEYQKKEEYIFI